MKRKYTIEEILDKGLEVMIRKGYHHSGLNELLKVSDIPKGSFYNHFASKEDFGVKLVHHYGNNLHAYMQKYLANKRKTPINRIKAFYRSLMKSFEEKQFTCGCLLGNMSQEVGDMSEAIGKAVDQQLKRTQTLLSQNLQEAIDLGEIKPMDTAAYANFIQNSWHGALLRMKSQQSIQPLKDFLKFSLP